MLHKPKQPCVYILASAVNGTLYIGVTSALFDRMLQHKHGSFEGFTKRHGVDRLVYFEMHPSMDEAISREKQLKKWKRNWKIRLIEQMNPEWSELFDVNEGVRECGPGGQHADEI